MLRGCVIYAVRCRETRGGSEWIIEVVDAVPLVLRLYVRRRATPAAVNRVHRGVGIGGPAKPGLRICEYYKGDPVV